MGCGALLSCVGGNHPPDQSQGELETRGPRHTPSGCGLVGVVVADEPVGGGSGMPGQGGCDDPSQLLLGMPLLTT